MKNCTHILAILMFMIFSGVLSAQNWYDAQWKTIHEHSKKGAFKSNLPLVLDIQNRAMNDNNAIQLIKSLKTEFAIVNMTDDDTKNDAASKFFAKIQTVDKKLSGEEKLVLKSLMAVFFSEYYDQHSWQISGRTNTSVTNKEGMETWSKLDFKNELSKRYAELENEKNALRAIPFSKYKTIFENASKPEFFPTIWDWTAENELQFLNNREIFTPNEIKTNQQKILAIYDDLILNNSGNTKLYFSHKKIIAECDFANCKDRLQRLQALYNSATEGDYKAIIADEIVEELLNMKRYQDALALIENVKKAYPKSEFLNAIKNKEATIVNPSIKLHFEQETESNKPIHIVAEWKNMENFSLNIFDATDLPSFMEFTQNADAQRFNLVKKSLVRKENFALNFPKDYQIHKTSLEIKPLPSGLYLVEYLVNNESRYFWFIASDSRIIYNNKAERGGKETQYKIVKRGNGQVLSNENLEFYEHVVGKTLTKIATKADASGIFTFPRSKNDEYYRSYLIKNSGNNYHLMSVYGSRSNGVEEIDRQKFASQIFLDRAIYRPSQTVYFKVISTQFSNKKETVIANKKQRISLYDANGEVVSTQNFTTNEFGSYHGSFVLPNAKLNGRFSLRIDGEVNAYKDFRVEEYKRPKFEVTFEPVKGEYKYGETLTIKGNAAVFSGVPLSNATVDYEIKKRNIRWMYFGWMPRGNDNENSILGSVKTDEKGEFVINVDLKKDETLDGIQVDNYEINASVTDINGETQSANMNVKVASVSHYISVSEADTDYLADEPINLKVEVKNYNGQNLDKSYQAKLIKIEEPQQIFRDNFKNEIQDTPQLSKAEFIQKFPHDYYDKTDRLKNREAENHKVIYSKTVSSNEDKFSLFAGKKLVEPGTYRIEFFNIEGKDTIKTVHHFEVWDSKKLGENQKPFLEVVAPKGKLQRGTKAKFYVYSAIPNVVLNVFVQNGKGETQTETLKISDGVLEYETIVPHDESVENLNVQFQIVAFNDVQTKNFTLKIADSKPELKIETVSFRDKILPGAKEKWTVKILGDQKEKIQAEVLTNMYDMSLDQFAANTFVWQKMHTVPFYIHDYEISKGLAQIDYQKNRRYYDEKMPSIPQFNWFNDAIYSSYALRITTQSVRSQMVKHKGVVTENLMAADAAMIAPESSSGDKEAEILPTEEKTIKVRQNLNETAFFYPNLLTDPDGNVSFEFTSPEALTQWKFMVLAHTKDARAATLEKEVVTQKEFSVTPNYPRFLREGDEINLQSKLSNLSNQKLNGSANLQILDAFTNENITDKFSLNSENAQRFSLMENGNSVANWKIKVPKGVSSIILKVVAKAGNFSDGEQQAIAVLPNRILVTDAVPVFVKEGQTKSFVLENLANNNSATVENVATTLELTTNPIWEVIFALPSLKNDQNNSADVVFNKWFADVLASEIFKANPKMKTIFEEYQQKDLLKSNLEKNQELKQLLLEETPWVLEAKNEEEQMAKISRLFDLNTMSNSLRSDWAELAKLQNPDGGFSWYPGSPSSYSTSLYILKNLGKINEWLKGNVDEYQGSEQKHMVASLVKFVDAEMSKFYRANQKNYWNDWAFDYLDSRAYWEKDFALKGNGLKLKTSVIQQAPKADIKDFTFFGLHRSALLFDCYGLKDVSKKILKYLKETSVQSETQGVYWKQNRDAWGWYSSKTVNHAGALEAFNRLTPNDQNFIEEMKIWLITQKEVSHWGTSRSTAEVIFTILNSGKSWTGMESDKVTVVWGGKPLIKADKQATGYLKSSVKSGDLDKNLSTVTITKPGAGIVQGGLFWQYYEDLDKVKSTETYISITKEFYKKIKTENGEELQKISANSPLKVGDKVTVRMILNTDRDMEFIHLKDMRAAGFEPLNVLSGYQWKNGLGYYKSTKDASTNFYIEYMPKGKYVFEYDYVANASGTFSNGITTLQNYYAPQMSARTSGGKVTISE